ncbi:MAG: hypothetical protein HOM34_06965 [Planctomycetes bacterium]|jgi:hypothetical protein|nr:hypothetical protein [Planctomycetota bacterium]MBT4029501.1 hypothetical protein [Planctomycetota bacterium]MBT4560629.1 hypothetical protein [Planctomycetota bacterium]MBT5101203.1 hypothetical protein [Planctomycetota bacterium]MBT5120444.1 hypothetical protein [Planctomycetota bacterium]
MLLLSLLVALPASSCALSLPIQVAQRHNLEQEETKQAAAETKKEKRKLPRLKSSKKKIVTKALGVMGRAKKEVTAAEAAEEVREVGRAASLECIRVFANIEKAERLPLLLSVLAEILPDEDLDLVWAKLTKKTAPSARVYLLRRWADSKRKDAAKFLLTQLKNESSAERFEVARGLAFRGEVKAIPELHVQLKARWTKESELLRADLTGLPREALGASLEPYLSSPIYDDLLAGLRLYSFCGRPRDAALLLPALRDNRSQIRLAAINACRITLDGSEPLERPSMTQLVEEGENWKKKIQP